MRNYWEKNLAVLRSRYPGLAEELMREGEESGGNRLVELSPPGDPVLTINGILIHSKRDPRREADRQAEALLSSRPGGSGPALVLGFGLGYGAEALVSRLERNPSQPLIVVEKDPGLFRLALKTRDLRGLLAPGNLVFIVGGSPGGVTGALGLLEKSGSGGRPLILKNRALASLSAEDEAWYAEAERRAETWASRDEINLATLNRFGKRWTGNLAANLPVIRDIPGVARLGGILAPGKSRGIPVFLAAAGPSLDSIGDHIGTIRERCVTVAVDTSLRFLTERGICPDFVVSVDPQYWNSLHLHRIASPSSCLIAESAVYPPALREASFKRALLCRSLFPLGRYIEDRTDPKGPLGAGGSVATTAWDFARLLGPVEIWTAGLDLSFPGLRTHFKGALFEENIHASSRRFLPAETSSVLALRNGFPFPAPSADGGRVLTDRRLSLYAAWFENRFSQERAVPTKSLDAGGLAIPYLYRGKIEEILALPPRRGEIDGRLSELFARIDGEFNSPGERERREQNYARALKSLIGGLEEIRENAEESESVARNALRGASTGVRGEKERVLVKLDGANKRIEASPVKDAAGFLFPPGSELEKQLGGADAYTRHLEFSVLLYRHLADSAGFTLEKLKAR
ncbi:MAG: DUF115 domain-containing protein [Treponema sp.]|jgi:hypothetical protein|nr:DUF115 domain-containing protein [Treponema sp.]